MLCTVSDEGVFTVNARLYNFINDTLVAESTVLGH